MKAKLVKNHVYTTCSGINDRDIARIIKAGTIVDLHEINDDDLCTIYYGNPQLPILVELEEITFDGIDGIDLSFWNLSRASHLAWFDLLKTDFWDLNITSMKKLITYGINADYHELPTGIRDLVMKYEELKDIIISI